MDYYDSGDRSVVSYRHIQLRSGIIHAARRCAVAGGCIAVSQRLIDCSHAIGWRVPESVFQIGSISALAMVACV